MKISHKYLTFLFLLPAFAFGAVDEMLLSFFSNLPRNISCKYINITNPTTNNPPTGKSNDVLSFDFITGVYLTESEHNWSAGDGKNSKLTVHYYDGKSFKVYDTENVFDSKGKLFHSISAGMVHRDPMLKVPFLAQIWLEPDELTPYMTRVKDAISKGKFQTIQSNDGLTLKIDNLYDFVFDNSTKLPKKIVMYYDYNDPSIFRNIYLAEYVNISGYNMPTNVKIETLDYSGNIVSRWEYKIDPKSIAVNSANMTFSFPAGCHVIDELSGENYIVSEVANVTSKEDAIVDILERAKKEADMQKNKSKE